MVNLALGFVQSVRYMGAEYVECFIKQIQVWPTLLRRTLRVNYLYYFCQTPPLRHQQGKHLSLDSHLRVSLPLQQAQWWDPPCRAAAACVVPAAVCWAPSPPACSPPIPTSSPWPAPPCPITQRKRRTTCSSPRSGGGTSSPKCPWARRLTPV